MGSMRMLDKSGDITIAWEEKNDSEVAAMIQKKMDAGVRFFSRKPFGDEEIQITSLTGIVGREVHVHDEDIAKLIAEGKAGIFSRAATAMGSAVASLSRRITDANEAARSNTYAVRQFQGG